MRILILFTLILSVVTASAKRLPVHCVEDEAKALTIIESLKTGDSELGHRMVQAAEALIGTPADSYYSSDSLATLRVNVDSFSPLMFVNNVIALAKASENPGPGDIVSFERQLEDISCRRGEDKGFPSIMYHAADWIVDNVARGNVRELTEDYAGVVVRTKSLDEMTRKRGDFAALADSAVFESVRLTEMGFRTHRIPTLKKETIKKKEVIEDLRDGDIIILVPNRDGIDYYDIGVISVENGLPYLIHLSPHSKTVEKEKEDLARYMGLVTKNFQGYRILRLK